MRIGRGSWSQRHPANVSSPHPPFYHISTTPTNRERKRWFPSGDTASHSVETTTSGFESQRHPGSIRYHPRNRKISTSTPTNWGRKRWFPGEIPPPRIPRDSGTPGDDKIPSPKHKTFHTSTTLPNQENGGPPARYRPARCGKPKPIG